MRGLQGLVFVVTLGIAGGVAGAAHADCAGPFLTGAQLQTELSGVTLTDNVSSPSYNEVQPTNGTGSFSEVGKGTPAAPESPNYGTVTGSTGSAQVFGASAVTLTYAYKSGFTTPPLAVMKIATGTYQFCTAQNATAYTTSVKH